jgi:hypothetical protein
MARKWCALHRVVTASRSEALILSITRILDEAACSVHFDHLPDDGFLPTGSLSTESGGGPTTPECCDLSPVATSGRARVETQRDVAALMFLHAQF